MNALHLLIKHEGSRNPVSRRTGDSTSGVTKAAAHTELNEIMKRIKTEADFRKEAKARSD